MGGPGRGQRGCGRGQAAGPELVGQPRHKVRAALLELAMLPGQKESRGPGPHVVSAGGLHPRSKLDEETQAPWGPPQATHAVPPARGGKSSALQPLQATPVTPWALGIRAVLSGSQGEGCALRISG